MTTPPNPTFSMMLVEISLKAIGRSLRGESEDSVEQRLKRIARSTAALRAATPRDQSYPNECSAFESTLEVQAPLLLEAQRMASLDEAYAALEVLKNTFGACKSRYQERNPDR